VDEVADRGEPEAGDGDVLLAVLLHQRHDHLRRRTETQVAKLAWQTTVYNAGYGRSTIESTCGKATCLITREIVHARVHKEHVLYYHTQSPTLYVPTFDSLFLFSRLK
jgi:hypothetical protein